MTKVKNLDSSAKLFFITDDFSSGLEMVKESGFYGLSMDNKFITDAQVKQAHDKNFRVTLYGVVTEGGNYSAISKSPDFIQTDNLDYLLKLFGKYSHNKIILFNSIK